MLKPCRIGPASPRTSACSHALVSAAHERKDHAFTTAALIEHIRTHVAALDRLEKHGCPFPDRRASPAFATPERAHLAKRIADSVTELPVTHEPLQHQYYDGLRFMLDAGTPDGNPVPLIDGGAFDWLRKLTANRNPHGLVASGMGSAARGVLVSPRGHALA